MTLIKADDEIVNLESITLLRPDRKTGGYYVYLRGVELFVSDSKAWDLIYKYLNGNPNVKAVVGEQTIELFFKPLEEQIILPLEVKSETTDNTRVEAPSLLSLAQAQAQALQARICKNHLERNEAAIVASTVKVVEAALGWMHDSISRDEHGLPAFIPGCSSALYNNEALKMIKVLLQHIGYTNYKKLIEKYDLYYLGYK